MSQSNSKRDPKTEPQQGAGAADGAEGWEGLSEEPTAGTLSPSDELEEALREASEAVEARQGARAGAAAGGRSGARAVDEATIEALSAELQKVTAEYEAAKEELEAGKDKLLRLTAEFDNFRKRTLKERQETQLYGHQNLVKDLLPTVDNLERAIEHAASGGGASELQGLYQGVELVLRELLAGLEKHGVTVIEAADQTFDPTVHEAMAQVPDASVAPNTVVQVLQKGYLLRDRMLRPARVVVSKAPEAEGGDGAGTG